MNEIIAALIGGACGIICAWITARVSSGASLKAAERAEALLAEETARSAAFLAAQVAPALRSYAGQCLAVANDDGYSHEHPDNGHNMAIAQIRSPRFKPSELSVKWESLPAALMTDILFFPESAASAAAALDDDIGYDDPPDHSAFFHDRQGIYCSLGIEALHLAARLHEHLHLPAHEYATNLQSSLHERKRKLTAEAEEASRRRFEHTEKLNALVPPLDGRRVT